MKKLFFFSFLAFFSLLSYTCVNDSPTSSSPVAVTAGNIDKLVGLWYLQELTACAGQKQLPVILGKDTILFMEAEFFRDGGFRLTTTADTDLLRDEPLFVGVSGCLSPRARYYIQKDSLILDARDCDLENELFYRFITPRFIDNNTLEVTVSAIQFLNDSFADDTTLLAKARHDYGLKNCSDTTKWFEIYRFKRQP